ncbi:MAG: helix-turn-helix domain-containing protein [Patescibacteria group bacterium]
MSFAIRKFDKSKPLGETLRELRRAGNVTLSELEKKTKIRRCYLEALENDNYVFLPEPLYTRKYLKTYIQALGGNEKYFLERFEDECGTCDFVINARLPRQRTKAIQFLVASKFMKFAGIIIVALLVSSYIGWQVFKIISPPEIIISFPENGYSTKEALITIQGYVKKGISVVINEEEVLLTQSGDFKHEIALERGTNIIAIEAKKRYSRPKIEYKRVVLEHEKNTMGINETF